MILLIDDDTEFLGRAEDFLLERGFPVLAATDMPTAIELLERLGSELDAILVDLDLGRDTGFELIQRVKNGYPHLPTIAFSGISSGATLESAMLIGASGILRKPVSEGWVSALRKIALDKHPPE
jgi:two-component system response regulator PilR (NtrC family)